MKHRDETLSFDYVSSLFNYDPSSGVITRKITKAYNAKEGSIAGVIHKTGYLHIRIDSVCYKAHRVAWILHYGVWPSNEIDHINRIKSDNRISNLRDVTRAVNVRNTGNRKDNTSGCKGVSYYKLNKKWGANISENKKVTFLGLFNSITDAEEAYMAAVKKRDQL